VFTERGCLNIHVWGDQSKEKRKVGRPITYKGDPDSNNLTEEERRRIKRRIANRESARRVRQKRQDLMEELQMSVSPLYLHLYPRRGSVTSLLLLLYPK
jgi:hypothetical protein